MTLSKEDARLLARTAAWDAPESSLADLTAERLALLARTEGLDFATALLYDRLTRVPANAEFLRAAEEDQAPVALNADLVAVVPGAFHADRRRTGADGARIIAIARQAGCEACVIPTPSFGGLDESARRIVDFLRDQRHRRILLVSLSKGGAEVKRALSLPETGEAFGKVGSWVSLSGMVQGTPLIGWLRQRPWRWWGIRGWLWWRGHGGQAMRDLRHQSGGWPTLPPHLRVVHAYGFPLGRHLAHPWAGRGYERLAPLGPNDGGGILLADLVRLPGIVCPLWGVDHYLRPSWDMEPLLQRIIYASSAIIQPRSK